MINRHIHKRNLPHLYYNEGTYFITYRLQGCISHSNLIRLHKEKTLLTNNKEQQKKYFIKYDALIESGIRKYKYLLIPEIADICKATLHYPDKKDYKLICYCLMPNHIHLVFRLINKSKSISKIMMSIKRKSARGCNKYLNRIGKFWQAESYDRLIRDDRELYYFINYVLENPVKAGLVENWKDWEYTYCNPDFNL